ncbi:MAG: sulfatase-like hydrolase/transferase [Thermoanaerobaculales bacterium]|nr:sulfatase-like hydrolase/transferase [Thermoanaerobaculales bacterium]
MTLNGNPMSHTRSKDAERRRRAGAWIGLAAFLGLTGCGGGQPGGQGLNLVLVTLDTTRADALGCYGAPPGSTPNLDRLAAEGALFRRATACTPLTLPSHSTILTGTWPPSHGVRGNGRDALADRAVTVAEVLRDAGYRTRAVVGAFVVKRMFGLAQGFDEYDEAMPLAAPGRPALERPGDLVVDAAIGDLTELGDGRFFLWVHLYDPHLPYVSREGHAPDSREAYAEEVAFADRQLGRLLGALDALGRAGDTAVLAVGDHGEGLGDHGETEHGFLLVEATQRVPLLLRAPGMSPRGRVVEARVRTVDVAPTLLELAGLEPPEAMSGSSLLALAAGSGEGGGRPAYGESWEGHANLALAPLRSLHEDDWKLVEGARPRLYDLAADPGERTDLAAVHPDRVAAMRAVLAGIEPAAGSGGEAPVDEETADALAALGYATGGGLPGSAAMSNEGFSDEDDPYVQIELAEAFSAAVRAIPTDPAAAEAGLRRVVLARPEAPAPLFDLTRLLRRAKREDEVLDLCREVLVAAPGARLPRLHLARLELQRGQLDEAIGQLELLLLDRPEDPEVHLELGRALRAGGELDRARNHLERASVLAPGSVEALVERARLEVAAGNQELAIRLLEEAQRLEPGSAAVARELARLQAGRGVAPDAG